MTAAAAGDYAQTGFGKTNYGVGGENAQVSCKGEFETTAEGDGGYGADGGNRKGGEGVECVAEAGEEIGGSVFRPILVDCAASVVNPGGDVLLLREGLAFLEICTSAETSVYSTGKDQGSCRPITCRHSVRRLTALGRILLMEVVNLSAKRSYE